MKRLILATLLLSSLQTQAAMSNFDVLWTREFDSYLQKIEANASTDAVQPAPQCSALYSKITAKGTMDFRYALGYFDGHLGDGKFGIAPSIDESAFHALRATFKKPCDHSSSRRTCGFSETGDPKKGIVYLTKTVVIDETPVKVTVTLTHASASEIYEDNVGMLSNRQNHLAQQSEQNFFGGLEAADIVFYNGHSRDGGGPDFKPPVLGANHKPNYAGFYHVKREGFKRMMGSLKKGHSPAVVGLFSCYSKLHFHKALTANKPKQALVLSGNAVNYFDTLLASLSYTEAVLRGQCGAGKEPLTQLPGYTYIKYDFFSFNF